MEALPTAIIDKSVFERIVEIPQRKRREKVLSELRSRFRILVPDVLRDEVLFDRGVTGKGKSLETVETMFREMMKLSSCWIANEIEWIFLEIVKRLPSVEFLMPSDDYVRRVAQMAPRSEVSVHQIRNVFAQMDESLSDQIRSQQDAWKYISGPGIEWSCEQDGRYYCELPSEVAFVEAFIRPSIQFAHSHPILFRMQLESLKDQMLRNRSKEERSAIESAFSSLTVAEAMTHNVLWATIMSRKFYAWAPLVRIKRNGQRLRVLRRSEVEQSNNSRDQRYVAMALLCDALLTNDDGMTKVVQLFQRAGLWHGKVFSFHNHSIICVDPTP